MWWLLLRFLHQGFRHEKAGVLTYYHVNRGFTQEILPQGRNFRSDTDLYSRFPLFSYGFIEAVFLQQGQPA